MKVGIITFHKAENFGSALQAYALSEQVKMYGHHVDVIDFVLDSDMLQYQLFRTKMYKESKKSFVADILYLSRNMQRKRRFRQFRNQYLSLTGKTYQLKDSLEELNTEYDCFICGSDQIWNLNCTQMFVPPFFLSFAKKNKLKIAFAPSMPCEVKEEYFGDLRTYIERLDYVSVREKQSITFLTDKVKVNKVIEHAMDPTLLLPAEHYIKEFSLARNDGGRKEKYIFVYILGDRESAKNIASHARELAKQVNCSIKYVYSRHLKEIGQAQYCYGSGPREFLELIYNATYVLTNSFHATVFSVLYEKKMCVFPREGSSSRMEELLHNLGLEKRLYREYVAGWIDEELSDDLAQRLEQMVSPTKEILREIFEQ